MFFIGALGVASHSDLNMRGSHELRRVLGLAFRRGSTCGDPLYLWKLARRVLLRIQGFAGGT